MPSVRRVTYFTAMDTADEKEDVGWTQRMEARDRIAQTYEH